MSTLFARWNPWWDEPGAVLPIMLSNILSLLTSIHFLYKVNGVGTLINIGSSAGCVWDGFSWWDAMRCSNCL